MNRQRAAFSLPELLMACTVTMLILVFTAQIFSSTTRLRQQSAEQIDTLREGRTVSDMIGRDLRLTCPPGLIDAPLVILPGEPGKSAGEELLLLISQPEDGGSRLCAVGYRTVWSEAAGAFELRRRFLDSPDLHAALRSTQSPDLPRLLNGAPEETVAEFVWALSFQAESQTAERLPEWVAVEFRAIGPSAARKLTGLPMNEATWNPPECDLYRARIAPLGRPFQVRIALAGAPRW